MFVFLLLLFALFNSGLSNEGMDLAGNNEVGVSIEQNPLAPIIAQLDSPQWLDALEQLQIISEQPSSKETSIANSALGDFYAGLTTVSGSWNLPPVQLQKAFQHYVKSVQHPFPDIAKSHYMISFIAYHRPSLVTEDFQPKYKYKAIQDSEDMDLITEDPSQQKQSIELANNAKDLIVDEQEFAPNIPLSLLHQSFAARGNFTPALISLGYKSLNGHYTPVSCAKACELYRVAAYQAVSTVKHNRPQIKLSTESVRLEEELASGRSTISEEEDIVQFYRYSADTGNVESQIAMGIIQLEGDIGGLPRDYRNAFHYFHLGATSGDASAMSYLAFMYQMGYGIEQNNETAIELYHKAAELGSPNAQTQLGILYYYGWGVEKDMTEAKRWFGKAVEKNEPEALLYLGRMAFAGVGVPKSYARARSYFQQASQAGNLVAMYNLGIITANGFGVRPSCANAVALYKTVLERSTLKIAATRAYKLYAKGLYDRAFIHYEIAADQGDTLSQMNVAWLYENGIGIPNGEQDKPKLIGQRKALEFYLRAAQQASPEAHLKVGDYYYYGWAGISPNPEMAAAYYRVASDHNHPQATFNLGYMHHRGIGLPFDPHLAKRYYDLAAKLNSEASLPSALALATLTIEQFLDTILQNGLYGFAWDTALILILSFSLLVAVIVRNVVIQPT